MAKYTGRSPFFTKQKGHVIEVWMGPPDEPESERVLAVDQFWIPSLIATLRGTLPRKEKADVEGR